MNDIHLMDPVPLAKVDLNLLVVLDVLLQERSIGRTAERLSLTSSAVSHALKRLRTTFDNELLVREGRQMVPTSRAQALAGTLPALLSNIERTFKEPEEFNPTISRRAFRLCAPDFMSSLLPHLLKVIAKEAPCVSVEFSAITPTVALDKQQGQFDAIIAPSFRQTDDLRAEKIGVWPWNVYGRKNHPAFSNWSIKAWASFPHLQIGSVSSSGQNPIERAASKHGESRRIGAIVTHFSMAAPILLQTDMLLSVPSVAMREAVSIYGLESRELPFEFSPLELALFRSATTGDKTEIRWFHRHIVSAVQALNFSE